LNARDGVVASYSALPSPDFWATKGAAQYLELEECSINEITDETHCSCHHHDIDCQTQTVTVTVTQSPQRRRPPEARLSHLLVYCAHLGAHAVCQHRLPLVRLRVAFRGSPRPAATAARALLGGQQRYSRSGSYSRGYHALKSSKFGSKSMKSSVNQLVNSADAIGLTWHRHK